MGMVIYILQKHLQVTYVCNFVKLIISRTELQTIVFPLIIHHKLYFLTYIRRTQFYKALFILHNEIKKYSELPT